MTSCTATSVITAATRVYRFTVSVASTYTAPGKVQDYLLEPKVEVLGRRDLLLLPQQPYGTQAQDQAADGHNSNPDIDETGRKVVSVGAEGSPAFLVAAERLLVGGRGGEIVASKLSQRPETREGAGAEQHLLLAVGVHGRERPVSSAESMFTPVTSC